MGGCATKPKDLDTEQAPAPIEAPAPVDAPAAEEKAEAPAAPQENKDGGEAKKEEPLVDVSEPAPEASKEVATTSEEKPATESKPTEAAKVEAVVEAPKEEKKETAAAPTPTAEVAATKTDKVEAPAKS